MSKIYLIDILLYDFLYENVTKVIYFIVSYKALLFARSTF